MIKPAMPTTAIAIMKIINPPKTPANVDATGPLTILVAAEAIMEKIKATAPTKAIIGKIILMRLE